MNVTHTPGRGCLLSDYMGGRESQQDHEAEEEEHGNDLL